MLGTVTAAADSGPSHDGVATPEPPATGETPASLSPLRRPRRKAVLAAVAAIVVVALLLLIVVVPALRPSGSGSKGGALTFYGARAVGDQLDAAYQGGNRSVVYAVGVGFNVSTTLPVQSLVSESTYATLVPPAWDCFQTALVNGNVTVPALQGNRSTGALPAWGLIYMNATGGIVVNVVNGVGTVVTTLSGPYCGQALANESLPSTVVDSSDMMSALVAYDTPFFSRFSNLDEVYQLIPANGSWLYPGTPIWSAVTWDCSSNRTGFTGVVDPATAQPITAQTTLGSGCGLPFGGNNSLQNALSVRFPYQTANTTTLLEYRSNITSASANITWSNLSVLLEAPNAVAGPNYTLPGGLWTTLTSGWSLEALGPGNTTIATYNASTWSWSGQSQQVISAGDQFQFELNRSLASIVSALTYPTLMGWLGGLGTFYGSLLVELPV